MTASPRTPYGSPACSAWLLALLSAMLLTMPGCGGCQGGGGPKTAAQKKKEAEKKEEEEKKKAKKALPNFETTKLKVEPVDTQVLPNYVKPGHWVSTQQVMRANNFDFSAELVTSPTNALQNPFMVDGTQCYVELTRPASLPKGQARYVESVCPIPPSAAEGRRVMFSTELLQRRGRQRVFGPDYDPTARMMDYQFFFVVLSSDPDAFAYVKIIDSIDPPLNDEENSREVSYYHVLAPRIDKRVPVPSHSMTWTSIAHVMWDRVNPDLMSQQQKDAMIDWLHWGGQLIVNGPGNLDSLNKSFLADYLPAADDGAVEMVAADFDQLNDNWSLHSDKKNKRLTFDLLEDEKLLGVKLKLREGASFVPNTGDLVAERRVGAGRVVTTSFSLASRHFKRWGSMDNFFNCCLLRRPPRIFGSDQALLPTMKFISMPSSELDPRLISNVRYFTRDLPGEDELDWIKHPGTQGPAEDERFKGYAAWKGSGLGGWNDRSGASIAARRSLKNASGIEVPAASFVLKSVAVYLLVLVPLNWGFFRLIGRVEWAWVAAPLIAVIGSLFVVRSAQLDIGFARSLTQTAVLEVQGGYPRAHLTRYTALYTSLSTNYDLELADTSALALPFSANIDYKLRMHDRKHKVLLRRGENVTLSGFPVASNSTGMLHSEQMYEVGSLELVRKSNAPQLANGTPIKLLDAAVFRNRVDNQGVAQAEYAFLGEVAPNTNRGLQFKPLPNETAGMLSEWKGSPAFSADQQVPGNLSLVRMLKLAVDTLQLQRGEYRLIAWTDEELEGAVTRPLPSHTTYRTLIVAHLDRPAMRPPASDRNLRIDFTEDDERVLESLEGPSGVYRDDPRSPRGSRPGPFGLPTPGATPATPAAPPPGAAPAPGATPPAPPRQ